MIVADLAGQVVTGKPFGWDEAQENNKLDFPDPAIPTMKDVPEWLTGTLDISKVVVPFAHINYTSYSVLVDDISWDLDPTTIKVADGKGFNEDQERDHAGRWTAGGDSGAAAHNAGMGHLKDVNWFKPGLIDHLQKAHGVGNSTIARVVAGKQGGAARAQLGKLHGQQQHLAGGAKEPPAPRAPAAPKVAAPVLGGTQRVGAGHPPYAGPDTPLVGRPISTHPMGAQGINGSFKVTYADGRTGIYKPISAEARMFQGRLSQAQAHSEVGAYQLDRALGLNVVPHTQVGTGTHGVGSIQDLVKSSQDGDKAVFPVDEVQAISILDHLTGNMDRHTGNYMNAGGHVVAIDNGLGMQQQAFHGGGGGFNRFWSDAQSAYRVAGKNLPSQISTSMLQNLKTAQLNWAGISKTLSSTGIKSSNIANVKASLDQIIAANGDLSKVLR